MKGKERQGEEEESKHHENNILKGCGQQREVDPRVTRQKGEEKTKRSFVPGRKKLGQGDKGKTGEWLVGP